MILQAARRLQNPHSYEDVGQVDGQCQLSGRDQWLGDPLGEVFTEPDRAQDDQDRSAASRREVERHRRDGLHGEQPAPTVVRELIQTRAFGPTTIQAAVSVTATTTAARIARVRRQAWLRRSVRPSHMPKR